MHYRVVYTYFDMRYFSVYCIRYAYLADELHAHDVKRWLFPNVYIQPHGGVA